MNKHYGSTLDSLLEELGELEEVSAMAAKKVLAINVERRMNELGLTTKELAKRMGTSRSQVHRILNEDDTGVTLKMLARLAKVLGMQLHVRLGTEGTEADRRRSQTAVAERSTRSTPRSIGSGRSARGDVAARADELLKKGFGRE